jgi:hypothetical protein
VVELSEAVLASLISTTIIVVASVLRIKYRPRVRVYGPFAYKLNESGTLTEIPAASIPSGVLERVRERVLNRFKRPKSFMLRKGGLAIFALAVFLTQLVIFSTMIS